MRLPRILATLAGAVVVSVLMAPWPWWGKVVAFPFVAVVAYWGIGGRRARGASTRSRSLVLGLGAAAALAPSALVLWAKNLPAWQYAGIGAWTLLWLALAPALGVEARRFRRRRAEDRSRAAPEGATVVEASLVGGLPRFDVVERRRVRRARRGRPQPSADEVERMVAERIAAGTGGEAG